MSRPMCGPQVRYWRTISISKRIGRGGCAQKQIGSIGVGHGVWGGEKSCGPRNHRKRLPARHFPLYFLNFFGLSPWKCILYIQLPGVQATESIAVETAQLSFKFARGVGPGLMSACCKVLAMHHGLFSADLWQRRPCLKNRGRSHPRRSCHSPRWRCLHRRWKRSQRQLDKSQLPWDCPKSHRH